PAYKLNWKAKRTFVELFVHVHRFQNFDQLRSGVPGHPRARLSYEVAFKRRYRNAHRFRAAKFGHEVDEILSYLLITFLTVIDEIHLVYRDDEVADPEQVRDEGMAPRLRHDAVSRVDENHRQIRITGARYQVTRVLLVARRIGDDELPL